MTETNEPTNRPIPDGGLADAMPDWLRRPPAWRNLPRTTTPATAVPSRPPLPDPDTSIIDPRTLVSVDDLPAWLREIAARPLTAPSQPPLPTADPAPPASEPEPPAAAPTPPTTVVTRIVDERRGLTLWHYLVIILAIVVIALMAYILI